MKLVVDINFARRKVRLHLAYNEQAVEVNPNLCSELVFLKKIRFHTGGLTYARLAIDVLAARPGYFFYLCAFAACFKK